VAVLGLQSAEASPPPPDVVVAGHVSLDVFPTMYGPVAIAPGHLVAVGPAVVSTGGVVTNTGLALHRLGVRVGLVGKVGADLFGRAVLESLTRHAGHLTSGISVCESEPTSYTIVIAPPGTDRCFLHCSGANQTFSAADVPYDALMGVRLFHFGYPPLMPRMYADGGAQLREMFARVLETGAATALDLCMPDPDSDAGRADWTQVLAHALPFVDVFAPSLEELLFMFDRPAYERIDRGEALGSVADYARLSRLGGRLTAMGAAVVAIKLGDRGLYLRTTSDPTRVRAFCERLDLSIDAWLDREIISPCFAVNVKGTTGSGDTTVAGFLAALLRGVNPGDAAAAATAVGACSVEAVDPTSAIPPWGQVAKRIANGWSRHPLAIELPPGSAESDPTGTITVKEHRLA
jgi:sugar/nucleoside kinase (ribokinase family)